MLRVVRVGEQLASLLGGGADAEQAEREAGRLAGDRRVGVQHALEVLERLLVARAQRRQAEAQAGAVLRHLRARPARSPRRRSAAPEARCGKRARARSRLCRSRPGGPLHSLRNSYSCSDQHTNRLDEFQDGIYSSAAPRHARREAGRGRQGKERARPRASWLVPRRLSSRKARMAWPWLAWIRPSAYSAPPSEYGLPDALGGR